MKVIHGFEVGDRNVTESTRKVLKVLGADKVAVFERDDSYEGVQTVMELIAIGRETRLAVLNGDRFSTNTPPYKIYIIAEDDVTNVPQYHGVKEKTECDA